MTQNTSPTHPCPHALHTMLASPRIREMVGDPSQATPAQAEFILTECKHEAKHRGAHRSADGKVSWTGKLADDEMAFAEALRAVIKRANTMTGATK